MGLGACVGMCWGLYKLWEFSCMNMWLCWYDEQSFQHTHLYYSLQLCVLWTMCTNQQRVSITAHILTDTFSIDPTLQQVLRCVCAYNALYSKGKYTGSGRGGRVGWSAPMLTSPQQALGLCTMCISHSRMQQPCLVLTPSCFVCVHDVLYTCTCVFGTHACVNLPLVFSVRVCISMCVWFVLIKFAFHIVVLLMVLLEIPITFIFILLFFNDVCYELCVQIYSR